MKWSIVLQCIFIFVLPFKASCQEFFHIMLENKFQISPINLLAAGESWRSTDMDKAYALVASALQTSWVQGNGQGVAMSLNMLGSLEFDKRNFTKSKLYFQEALIHYPHSGMPTSSFLPWLYTNLAGVYSCLGYNDSAVHYQYLCMAQQFRVAG